MSYARLALPVTLLALAFAASAPASAIFIVTPLQLHTDTPQADVGDTVTFHVTPTQDWNGTTYAGQTVLARFSYDPNEGTYEPSGESDGTVTSDEPRDGSAWQDPTVYGEVGQVALDGASRATFTWTVPAEVDDRNVIVNLVAPDGEILASAHVGVGDAAPVMYALMEGGGEPTDEDLAAQTGGPVDGGAEPHADGEDEAKDSPMPGLALTGLALVGAALLLARRA